MGRIFIGHEAANTTQREEPVEGSEGRGWQGCLEIGGEGFEIGDDGAALLNEMGKRVVIVAGKNGCLLYTSDAADE